MGLQGRLIHPNPVPGKENASAFASQKFPEQRRSWGASVDDSQSAVGLVDSRGSDS